MQIKRFFISGINPENKRKKTMHFDAASLEDVQIFAKKHFDEPINIVEKDLDPPSDAQVRYAISLGGKIPANANSYDLNAIISKLVDKDIDASQELKDYANYHNVIFSEYVGMKDLCTVMFSNLENEGKAIFFAYAVYCHLKNEVLGNLESHPNKDVFYGFSSIAVLDNRTITSIKKYRGEDLLFFGKKIKNGEEYIGGSIETIAYNEAKDYILQRLRLQVTAKRQSDSSKSNILSPIPQSNKGCSPLLFLLFIVTIFCIYLVF